MERQDLTPTGHADTSRPSIGFPLGTALLLIILFSLSGFFSCCYHWDRLRSFRRSFSGDTDRDTDHDTVAIHSSPSKLTSIYKERQSLPVLMPGDRIPKFIALPCPCEAFRPGKMTLAAVDVEKPPQPTLVHNHIARFGVYYNS